MEPSCGVVLHTHRPMDTCGRLVESRIPSTSGQGVLPIVWKSAGQRPSNVNNQTMDVLALALALAPLLLYEVSSSLDRKYQGSRVGLGFKGAEHWASLAEEGSEGELRSNQTNTSPHGRSEGHSAATASRPCATSPSPPFPSPILPERFIRFPNMCHVSGVMWDMYHRRVEEPFVTI